MITITVKYSCVLCHLSDIEVKMPARPEQMDLMVWMDEMGQTLANDHQRRSPRCRPQRLHQIKIPMDGAKWVGGPPIA